MTNQHPITPPPELVREWTSLANEEEGQEVWSSIATQAAQWGADQQLEACCENLKSIPSPLGIPFGEMASNALRNACRPEPPSLKEQALAALNVIEDKMLGPTTEEKLIRKALESL